jgi:hypothetical protein
MVGVVNTNTYYLWDQHGYPGSNDAGGVTWRMVYFDLGVNLENLIKDAVDNQKYEYAGIGYAIKAWAFQQTTDQYGPIILDEAFNTGQLTFHYQDQPDVYAKVREWVGLSIKYLNMTSPISYSAQLASVTGDGIYKGDKAKWKKFAYAVLAMQYGHLINKPEFKTKYADSVSKYVGLSFVNESEDPTVFFTATSAADANLSGPLNAGSSTSGVLGVSNAYCRQTTTILGLLTGGVRGTPTPSPTTSLDPRLSRFLTVGTSTGGTGNPTGTVYVGAVAGAGFNTTTVPNILGALPAGGTVFNGKYIFTDKARYPIMTYGELQFILAEALYIKGTDPAGAYLAYKNGIQASFDFYNTYGRTANILDPAITTAEMTAYLTSSEVAQTAATLTLSDIMQQKYIALWGWGGLETWCDLRKYHYNPAIYRTYVLPPTLTLAPTNGGKLAYRIRPRYNSEYVWNLSELAKWGGTNANYNTQETYFSLP